MKLIIYTPEKTILEKEVDQVTLPASTGEITVLPGHTDLVSYLGLGNITFRENDKTTDEFISIESGFVEINKTQVKIFADIAIHSEEYNEQMLEEIKAKAVETMKNAPKDASLEKLQSQIRVAELNLVSKRKRKI